MIRPRKKPRPGRLKGKDMEALRREVFERDAYRCRHPITSVGLGQEITMPCLKRVTWESGHLAHIKARRMGGDSPENTYCCCAEHHRIYHAYGPSMQKPCPSKV